MIHPLSQPGNLSFQILVDPDQSNEVHMPTPKRQRLEALTSAIGEAPNEQREAIPEDVTPEAVP